MSESLSHPPPESLAQIARVVESHCGLSFVGGRRSELASKASRAFAESGRPSWDAYVADLAGPAGRRVLDTLVSQLTIGETYFFRHRAYFDVLERETLPRLIAARRATRRLRVWSAGCATGEEAYSLAILLRRLLPDLDSWDVAVLGTDLNADFLRRAREGRYGDWSLRGADDTFKAAHFTSDGRQLQILPSISRLVRFAQLNLAEPLYPSPTNGTSQIDLILCRNVLIYLAPDVAQRVVARLRAALVPDGYLVVGPSDPLPGLLAGFAPHRDADAIIYQRTEDLGIIPAPVPTQPTVAELPRRAPRPSTPPSTRPQPASRRPPARSATIAASAIQPLPDLVADWLALWELAREAAARGDLDTADALCRRAAEHEPARPEPYYLLGVLCQSRGDDDAALAEFRKALYLDRTFVPALLAVATLYRQSGQHQRASRALEQARRQLHGRPDDEPILAAEPVTVGRLRAVLGARRKEPV